MNTPNAPTASFRLGEELAAVLAGGGVAVALESTIFSGLGLPAPHNREAFDRCRAAVRSAGAAAAVTAVVDGVAVVGLTEDEAIRVLAGSKKTSARDLGVAVGQRWDIGVTTVAASVTLAAVAGIDVFATGGIGGVHRGSELTGDISADLHAIARHPVITVTAGAKAFLDLPRTLEFLDTIGVPVLGMGTDEFPAFYSRSSGVAVPHRVESAEEIAAIVNASRELGYDGGFIIANPIPAEAEIPAAEIEPMITRAVADAARAGIHGPGVTPFILAALAAATEGRSIPANLALAESNALLGGQIAVALRDGRRGRR